MTRELPQLGRYRLLRPLGSGAMGDVFLAEDPQIERRLAIKTVRMADGDRLDHEERRERLLREAKAAGRIHHPNVVTLFDVGETAGLLYLVFEYVEGMDLAARARSAPPLTVGDVLRLGREVAAALEAAHRQGIVHRDIKPTNVLIGPHGEAKVTDFGIAKLAQATELTQTGSVVGSPQYMSPEQVRGETLDGRSDLFALGVLLYELFTRRRPFDGESLTTLVYQILSQEPQAVEAAHPGLPQPLATLIRRLMAKDPAARPDTAGEVAAELAHLSTEFPAAVLAAPAAPNDLESGSTQRLPSGTPLPTPPTSPVIGGVPAVATPSATWALAGGALAGGAPAGGGLTGATGPTGPMPPLPPLPPTAAPPMISSPRRGPGLWVAVVVLLTALLAATGAVWWWSRSTEPGRAAGELASGEQERDEPATVTVDVPAEAGHSGTPDLDAPGPGEVEAPPGERSAGTVRGPTAGGPEEPQPPLEASRTVPSQMDDAAPRVDSSRGAPPPDPPAAITTPPPATRREPARREITPPTVAPPPTVVPPPTAAPASPTPPTLSREEERWQRAAAAAGRELATGLALHLAVEPSDAYVRLWRRGDERSVVRGQAGEFRTGKEGKPLDLPGEGDYVLTLLREGLPDQVFLLHARGGEGASTLAANLRSTAARGPKLVVVEQSVAFSGTPEAEVWLDGRRVGTTSDWPGGLFAGGDKSLQLSVGDHTLRLVAPGREPLEIRVEVRSGAEPKRATIEYRL